MTRNRRRNARKVAKLARVLATLDEHARTVRPAPKRAAKVSFSR
jgi:Ser/Thr protein kinase RdoA (MazF antagonist)